MLTNGIYLMLLSKGCESITREQINSWEFATLVAEAKKAVPKVVATTWLNLKERGCLPHWAEFQIDKAVMERAAL